MARRIQEAMFLFLNWEISLLAKTSKLVYNDITKVMKLPSSSSVMTKTDLVEKQGIIDELGINLFTIQTMKENIFSSVSNFTKYSLSFKQ